MAEVKVKISAIDEASKVFQRVSGNIEGMGKKMSAVGKKMSLYVTAPLTLLGGLAVKSSMQFEEGTATIARATGKTGEELRKLEEIMVDVNRKVVADVGEVAKVIGELDTRLDLTGEQTKEFSTKMLKMSHMTKTDAVEATRLITRTMHDWGIETHRMGEFLDQQFVLAQKSGIGIANLNTMMVNHGAQLRLLGFDYKETMSLLAKWEREGENAQDMLMGMNMAIADLSREGIDPMDVGFEKLIERIKEAESETDAIRIAIEKLGMRAGTDFAMAVRAGSFAVDDYTRALEDASGAITETERQSRTLGDEVKLVRDEIATLAKEFGEVLKPIIRDYVIPAIRDLTEWFRGLTGEQKILIVITGALIAAIGPLLIIFGYIAGAISKMIVLYKSLAVAATIAKKSIIGLIAVKAIALAKFIAIGAAIAVVVTAFIESVRLIIENWQKIVDFIKQILLGIKEDFRQAIRDVAELFGSLVELIRRVIGNVFQWLTDRWQRVRDFIRNVLLSIKETFRWIVESIIEFFDPLIKLIEWVFERMKMIVDRARELGRAVKGFAEEGVDTWKEIARGIGEITGRGLEAVGLREPQRITNVYVQGGNYLDREAARKFAETLAEEYNLRF